MKKIARILALVLIIASLFSICPSFALAAPGRKPKEIIQGYNMVFYCTKQSSYPYSLMFRDYSIENYYSFYGAQKSYGEKCRTRYVDAADFAYATEYPADESYVSVTYDDQTRSGYQMGLNSAYNFGDDNYFWFVESVVTEAAQPSYKKDKLPSHPSGNKRPDPAPRRQPEIVGYNMVHYGTQTAEEPHYRIFRDYSIQGQYDAFGARKSYGEKHLTKYVTAEQMSMARSYPANKGYVNVEYNGEQRMGYQYGTTTAYNFWDDNYIWYIESVVTK